MHEGLRRRPTNLLTPTSCSSTWSSIKKGEIIVSKGAKWVAGKDSNLLLWCDKWLSAGTLRSRICGPLNRGEEEVRLKDIASFHGWNWDKFSFSFPKDILLEMKATPIPYSKSREDRLSWSLSPSGEFQLKDAYRFYGTQFLDWLRLNCKSKQQCGVSEIDWAIVFPIAVWSLWLHRNSVVFGKPNICKDLKAETLAKATEMAYLGITEKEFRPCH
ncbi:putative ribonuclease h protein [Quercus suber]|uniref:Ribonuclease h protein n=1 Tax=Quercus suber TaxID=58331 RepID=A0AAW0LV29_QUESU